MVTGAIERALRVGTVSISVTVVGVCGALLDILKKFNRLQNIHKCYERSQQGHV